MKSLITFIYFIISINIVLGCICGSSSGNGRFCGHNPGMQDCIPEHIYQCDHLGGVAQDLGPCINGCITTPVGQNDRCA